MEQPPAVKEGGSSLALDFPFCFTPDVIHDPPDPDLRSECLRWIKTHFTQQQIDSALARQSLVDVAEARLSLMVQFLLRSPGVAKLPLGEHTEGRQAFMDQLQELNLVALPPLPHPNLSQTTPSLLIRRKVDLDFEQAVLLDSSNINNAMSKIGGNSTLGTLFDVVGLSPANRSK